MKYKILGIEEEKYLYENEFDKKEDAINFLRALQVEAKYLDFLENGYNSNCCPISGQNELYNSLVENVQNMSDQEILDIYGCEIDSVIEKEYDYLELALSRTKKQLKVAEMY